jgi:nucleotide-binding universal stress UspA family protein
MPKYKKILVAFDGSDSSRNALRQAINLARTEKCWVKVVSVVPSYEGDIELTGVKDIESAIKGPAEKLLAEAREIASAEGVSVITNIEQGEAYERIVDVAESENCDLIVMGRKGHSRIEKALVGCVTERVIGHTHKDVLVVPKGSAVGMDNILLATDGSSYSESASTRAIDLARSYGATLGGVSVVDVTDEFQAEAPAIVEQLIKNAKAALGALSRKAESAGVKAETFVREGEAYDVITGLAASIGAHLIVMGSHGRKGLSRLLMGSVTQKVIGFASCPVLVVRS